MSSPISLAILLIGFATLCSITTGFMFSSWLFYFLILVFLGGVIVVLIFMTSVCVNTKLVIFFPSKHLILIGFVLALFPFVSLSSINYSRLNFCLNIYSLEGVYVLLFLILSLLLCIISVVNVVKLEYGPLVFRL